MTDDVEFNARLQDFGVEQVTNRSVFAKCSPSLIRGWRVALDRASRYRDKLPKKTRGWIEDGLGSLACLPENDQLQARAAEIEAALRLSWIGKGETERVPENSKGTSVDLRIGDVNVEVYCPQEHRDERQVVKADLTQQLNQAEGPVRVAIAIGHPTTGSGRKVDKSGCIYHNPASKALVYPANKLIDRLLHTKRDGKQFQESEKNILWLDLKHGLDMCAVDCMPFRSEVTKGQCFIGTHGVWHAFYGKVGSPLFPERTSLEWPVPMTIYEQDKNGWFREMPKVSAVLLSVLDGVLFFENPWADMKIDITMRKRFVRLSEFRPELSWFGQSDVLEHNVSSMLDKIAWLTTAFGVTPTQIESST